MNIVSESGLYKILMRSDKPQAREFQDWATCEVLPTIREDGGYIEGEVLRSNRIELGEKTNAQA